MLWLGLIYLVALLALFVTAFWTVDFGGNVTRDWTLDNFKKLFEDRRLPHGRGPDDPGRGLGDRDRRRAGAADRVLHGQDRAARRGQAAGGRRADAAVGELPREGVRVEGDDHARGSAGLGHRLDARLRHQRRHHHAGLPVAAVHGAADLRRLRRLPDSLLEASSDLGAKPGRTLAQRGVPDDHPVAGGGIDLHLLAVARRLHRRRVSSAARPRCSATSSSPTVAPTSPSPRR